MPGSSGRKRPIARTRAVALSPTGRVWAAATTEGLLLYSLDDELVFDPTDLTEELTPEACTRALASRAYVRALLIALRLGDGKLLRHCVFSTPVAQVPTVGAALPAAFVPQVSPGCVKLGRGRHRTCFWSQASVCIVGEFFMFPGKILSLGIPCD